MTASDKRIAVRDLYKTILGRNSYNQDSNKRQCVYKPYSDGKYYSDCSSSVLNTFYQIGVISSPLGNTATIHYNGKPVSVDIANGIPDESDLRIGDCLMFAGNDPSRPLQIGHVEMYVGGNTLYGHGSGTPSSKNMKSYCAQRYSQKASNGVRKGLIEVRRFIPDDIILTEGWVLQKDGSWYFYQNGYPTASEWILHNHHWYRLGPDGKMLTGWHRVYDSNLRLRDCYFQEDGPFIGAMWHEAEDRKGYLEMWYVE